MATPIGRLLSMPRERLKSEAFLFDTNIILYAAQAGGELYDTVLFCVQHSPYTIARTSVDELLNNNLVKRAITEKKQKERYARLVAEITMRPERISNKEDPTIRAKLGLIAAVLPKAMFAEVFFVEGVGYDKTLTAVEDVVRNERETITHIPFDTIIRSIPITITNYRLQQEIDNIIAACIERVKMYHIPEYSIDVNLVDVDAYEAVIRATYNVAVARMIQTFASNPAIQKSQLGTIVRKLMASSTSNDIRIVQKAISANVKGIMSDDSDVIFLQQFYLSLRPVVRKTG